MMIPPRQSARRGEGLAVWLTGLSGSGKSTLARALYKELCQLGIAAELLDADQTRRHLSAGLGFTREDREENVRRLAYVAGLLVRHGIVVVVACMSPYRSGREDARERLAGRMVEVFVDAPLEVCEARDPVGLYRRYRTGSVQHLSGMDEAYEPPQAPEVHCKTAEEPVAESLRLVLEATKHRLHS